MPVRVGFDIDEGIRVDGEAGGLDVPGDLGGRVDHHPALGDQGALEFAEYLHVVALEGSDERALVFDDESVAVFDGNVAFEMGI